MSIRSEVCVRRAVPAGRHPVALALDELAGAHWTVTVPSGQLGLLDPCGFQDATVARTLPAVVYTDLRVFPSELAVHPGPPGGVELLLRPVWRKRVAHPAAALERYWDVAQLTLDQLALDVAALLPTPHEL